MSAVDETTELEYAIRDQSRRLEDLRNQLRKARAGGEDDAEILKDARSQAVFYRNNYVFSKRHATQVDLAEFSSNRASMYRARERVEDLRSSIAATAAKVGRLEALIRQCERTILMASTRLKGYGQLVQFTRKQ